MRWPVALSLVAAAVLIFLTVLIGMESGLFALGKAEPEPAENEDDECVSETVAPSWPTETDLRRVRIASAGDITAHMPQINLAYVGDGKYDFNPCFELIAPYLKDADLAVGNLETAQAGPDITFLGYTGYTGYPCFNAPIELSEALKNAGFDLVSMAHNHSLDRGLSGLKATLENVRGVGLTTFGTHMNEEERNMPVIKEINGIKIAFLSYTYGTNMIPIPRGHEYAVNLIENFHTIEPIIEDMELARREGADFIAVAMHWGDMYITEPPQGLREIAEELAVAGADFIMGGHPHVVQPLEWFHVDRGYGRKRGSLVTYSMGNFLSNQRRPPNPTDLVQYGKLLHVEVTKDMETKETWISDVQYEITWVHREWGHRILPLSQVLAGDPSDFNLTPARVEELRGGYRRNEAIILNYGFEENAPWNR